MPRASRIDVGSLTNGVLSTAVDCSLWTVIFLAAASAPQSNYGVVYRAAREADRFLSLINYDVIKRGIAEARRAGLIRRQKQGQRVCPEITKEGLRRLQAVVPRYDQKRVWDGKTYLVSYDIPESRKKDRETLREYVGRIGCGKLQDSVYITPYDPRDVVADFVDSRGLAGTIIVSAIGKDGSVGDETLPELINRVYGLKKLNARYEEWLRSERGRNHDQWSVMTFLAILQDDPQLPFGLLPKQWMGCEAYQEIKQPLKDIYSQLL